jgi:hypothetical protein
MATLRPSPESLKARVGRGVLRAILKFSPHWCFRIVSTVAHRAPRQYLGAPCLMLSFVAISDALVSAWCPVDRRGATYYISRSNEVEVQLSRVPSVRHQYRMWYWTWVAVFTCAEIEPCALFWRKRRSLKPAW